MKILLKFSVAIFPLLHFVGEWWKGFSVIGSASPPIAQIGQKMILSCEMKGCTSSNFWMHVYKREYSKNQTLFIHNSTRQHNVQEKHPRERDKNGSPRGEYKNGLLSVTLDQVEITHSGQYVCAGTCDDVYKESEMELQVEGKINASIGEVAVFSFQPFETYKLSHLKLLWTKTDSGKRQKIYSYLHQEACPSIYSEDILGDRCSSSHGPIIQEWFGKNYQQRAVMSKTQMLMRNIFLFKVSNIQTEDAGKYSFSAESQELHKVVIFTLSVTGSRSPPDFLWVLRVLIIFVLVLIIITVQCCYKHKDPLRAENDRLRAENCKYKEELEQLKPLKEFCDVCSYKVDVTFDSKKAHPRLEVLETGKSVIDTGNISMIFNSEDIPTHMGILATQGYSKGKYYWEVDVIQKNTWHLGVASESICRKGKITFSPKNGYWVIGPGDRKDYYAWTDPWTFLNVTRKLTRIGIFLDILADKRLSFYDIHSKKKLYTFTINCSKKLYPFFSLGSIYVQEYNLPVKIVSKK